MTLNDVTSYRRPNHTYDARNLKSREAFLAERGVTKSFLHFINHLSYFLIMEKSLDKQLELIARGAVEIILKDELKKKIENSIKTNKPLNVKAGFDPTAPDLHLGHVVLIQKLKHFQDLGHRVIFLIGDYTGMIGDPSGKSATRPVLTRDEIKKNAETYKKQIFKILDPKKTVIDFNSRWMDKMSAHELIELSAKHTVARMLERDDFSKRYKGGNPISVHEFLYPLIQGYDSVALKADVELGGTDQIFNLLVGRELQRAFGQEPQVVLTTPLMEGTDGVNKMSKSLDNYIGINEEPKEIFGKTMSVSDEMMIKYYEILSNVSDADWKKLKPDLKSGKVNPRDAKVKLAKEFVERFHSKKAADEAEEDFVTKFKKKEIPDDIETIQMKKQTVLLPNLLAENLKLVSSKSEARRMVVQGAVKIDGKKVSDANSNIEISKEMIVQVGKRKFKKILV